MLNWMLLFATKGAVLLYDNALSHVSRVTHTELSKWKQLANLPYCPEMSPCAFHVFGPMEHLKGKLFNSENKLQDAVKEWVWS
ncbi:hypothetical protein TNIN_454861 [Trichonephila inaurata madagascariensis]|uniref:Transposase n=1 Tax=Trichonephila inaurata madagascariensis TaxID=2747483 RepID=A0A8X6YVD4_9ARAC|nr:hypothetical protein TNIN_454861 [Trichonephila inaurata madagascariensis]